MAKEETTPKLVMNFIADEVEVGQEIDVPTISLSMPELNPSEVHQALKNMACMSEGTGRPKPYKREFEPDSTTYKGCEHCTYNPYGYEHNANYGTTRCPIIENSPPAEE